MAERELAVSRFAIIWALAGIEKPMTCLTQLTNIYTGIVNYA
jgi:hypothetical protein